MSEELIDEVEITEDNFSEYFFDVRMNRPQRGQCMAKYTAIAELVDGNLKRDVIYLLSTTDKVNESIELLRKIALMDEGDAISICLDIAKRLHDKENADEIANHPHEYKLEALYYTQEEHVPTDDPHWSVVELKNLEEFIEETEKGTIKSKIVMDPTEEMVEEFKGATKDQSEKDQGEDAK
jgi:hypothetical protein